MALRKLKEFCIPESGDEVIALLDKYGDNALIVAGGTFVHGLEARGLLSEVEALIDVQKLGLGGVRDDDGLRVGATATYAALERSATVSGGGPWGAIGDALTYPPAQIRNVATVGGCVAAACPFFDLPTAFLALDARVGARGAGGPRELALDAFLAGMFENALDEGEYVTEVVLPAPPPGSASAFLKLEGNANDLAIVNAAVCVTVTDGKCTGARVAIGGGCADTAVRAPSAEAVLEGAVLDAQAVQAAAEAAGADIDPMSDHRASARYRTAVAKVMVERALAQALGRLG